VGEVAVAGDDDGVGDEGQERDEAGSEVEKDEQTGRGRDDDDGKWEADAIDGEYLQPFLEVVAASAEDKPLIGEKSDGNGKGERGVVGNRSDSGVGKFGEEEFDGKDEGVGQGDGKGGVEAADHEEADDFGAGQHSTDGRKWAVRLGVRRVLGRQVEAVVVRDLSFDESFLLAQDLPPLTYRFAAVMERAKKELKR
jgi:hypothetical protein